MKFPAILFASILPLAATPENPFIPETWFQSITATDGSTQQCVVFTTIPGIQYTFYHSHDLAEWTEVGTTYGLGQEFAAAMWETAPAPPPPDPESPPAEPPAYAYASISIQPSPGTEGGTVVSWASLDHGNAMRTVIAGNMGIDWQTVPLFGALHGSHHFFINHTFANTEPPEENPPLDTKDAAMIANLEAGWADFNTQVATSVATARNTPPPPPPALDARGFWRIKVDASLDSDNDGSPDHLEFALAAAQGAAADGLAGNAFNADTNNDGIPDGEQLDTDSDGIPDAQDIAPEDDLVAYETVSLPRYAMFTFADGYELPYGHEGTGYAFAINDRGTVLFPDRVWKGGEFQILVTDTPSIPAYYLNEPVFLLARAINDLDQILGAGYAFPDYSEDLRSFHSLCYWGNPSEVPLQLKTVSGTVTTYAEVPYYGYRSYTEHLGNDGSFFAQSYAWDSTSEEPEYYDADLGWEKWTLPTGANPITSTPAAKFAKGIAPGGIVWGSEYKTHGDWEESRIIAPFDVEIPMEPRDVLTQGDIGNLIATTASPNASTVIRKEDGQWRISPLLADALDIADNGTAIRKRVDSRDLGPAILLNGKWTELERAVPGIPERWTQSTHTRLSDTSPGGWILAHDHPGDPVSSDDISAALLPIRIKGRYTDSANNVIERAVGVDDFSIGSSNPNLHPENLTPVDDRIWIMAPLGGPAKTIVFDAPLHSSASLKISSAPGITFGGEQEKLLTSSGQSFDVVAGAGVSTGEEHLANLWINNGTYDTPALSNPIGFKVMKNRVVNVTVYKVGETLNTGQGVNQLDADLVPTKAELETFLNNVYRKQVNVSFQVDIKPIQANSPIDYEPDGTFTGGVENLSADQFHVRLDAYDQAGAPEAGSNIEIYLLGTNKLINSKAVGMTHIGTKSCWVKAKVENTARIDEELAQLMNTISHEIGHVLIGSGHPGAGAVEDEGPAPLPGTNHSKRLMRLGSNNPKGFDHLLVKAEWDMIEEWLANEVDNPLVP